jgi:spermidine/putrescine transport system ATP-binding protein
VTRRSLLIGGSAIAGRTALSAAVAVDLQCRPRFSLEIDRRVRLSFQRRMTHGEGATIVDATVQVNHEPATAGRPLVEAVGLGKQFGSGRDAVRALDRVDLAIARNEFFTLLGPSGCGKTTLLRLIGGFEHPSEGQVLLDGEPLTELPPFRRPINTVFQSYALFPHLSVAENIGFGLDMLGRPRVERTARVEEMLDLVQLADFRRRKPAQLSGGQQQRVALARALASAPRVLLLDEPLSALDLKLRKEMQIELKRLQTETGITFVFVTHDQEEALTMSDRIAVMDNGRILQVGTPTEIYEAPAHRFVADFIGEINFFDARIAASDGAGVVVDLATGGRLRATEAGGAVAGDAVSVAIRPERIALVAGATADDGLTGTVETVVYRGTDTTYLVRTVGGILVDVRSQNRDGARRGFARGDRVGLSAAPDAVRILVD